MSEGSAVTARVDFVDALRGFALLGLFLVHMSEMFELYWADPTPSLVHDGIFALFAGKSYALLALCFGFSFYVMGRSAAARGDNFAGRFAWRVILLWGIGWLHGLVYRGDIIIVLATEGLFLIPFFRVKSDRMLVALACLLFLNPYLIVRILAARAGADWANATPLFFDGSAFPAYLSGGFTATLDANLWNGFVTKWSYYIDSGRICLIFGLFLIGLALGRSGYFARETTIAAHARRIAAAALLVAGTHFIGTSIGDLFGDGTGAALSLSMLTGSWNDLAVTALSAFLLHAIWQGGGRPLVGWLAKPGRMTLSFYVGQSIVFVPVFYGYGLGGWRFMSQAECLILGLVAFGVQALLAHAWFRRFHYGPIEWIWRAGTRMTTDIPFRR